MARCSICNKFSLFSYKTGCCSNCAREETEDYYSMGKAFYDSQEYDEAFPLLEKAAVNGIADAEL